MAELRRAPATMTSPLGSAATARPSSSAVPPKRLDQTWAPVGEYLTRYTSWDGPIEAEISALLRDVPPRLMVPTKWPVAKTLPPASTATALPRSSFTSPACMSHENAPPVLATVLPACGLALA